MPSWSYTCQHGSRYCTYRIDQSKSALIQFFPLAIENIKAFFLASDETPLTNPLEIITLTFATFNVLTLGLTAACIVLMFLLR